MTQTLRPGDRVRVAPGVSSATHRSVYPHFVPEMDEYLGRVMTVEEVSSIILIDGYSWHPEWLVHVHKCPRRKT